MDVVPKILRVSYVETAGLKTKDAEQWHVKWRGVVRNAKCRKLKCTLTFRQYLRLAVKAGLKRPTEIGMKIEQYNLGRKGDTGGYEKGNCRFITSAQNRLERITNGGIARATKKLKARTPENLARWKAMGEAKKGLTKYNDEGTAKMAVTLSKRFRVKDPNGVVYKSRNLNQFCKDHALNMGAMAGVCSGRLPHYKQWTGTYL